MIIESVHVKNFRSIMDETLRCDELTALVGANGSGKSTFLRALDLFYTLTPKIEAEDFHANDTSQPITITVKYSHLNNKAKERFEKYLQGDALTIGRVFSWNAGKATNAYHGASLQNPDFSSVRNTETAKGKMEAYKALRLQNYPELPSCKKESDGLIALKAWEAEHLGRCKHIRDDGQFFGFKEVGTGYLGEFTKFLFVPAVRDASDDAAEGKGSVLTELMDLVVRSVVANKEVVKNLKEDTQNKYEEIMKPDNLRELSGLSDRLSKTLQTFAPNVTVDLKWLPLEQIKIEMPKADVKLVEDRYGSAVHRTGHGLQRAYILTMLQHLVMAKAQSPAKEQNGPTDVNDTSEKSAEIQLPNLVLAVEEPELYQHPNRQRHLARIFRDLASGSTPGVAEKTQVIYATHSPLFVGLDRFDQIRILRKNDNGDGKPRISKVVGTTLDKVAERLWEADGQHGPKFTRDSLLHRVQAIMTPWVNEGFFAQLVVLVEGEDDYAAIHGTAKSMSMDFEGGGISIIPVMGKRSLDRPIIIFQEFGIPVFVVWDSDEGKGATGGSCAGCQRPLDGKPDPVDNRRLLRLVGGSEEDWPSGLAETYCCFKGDLERVLKDEIGSKLFDDSLAKCQQEFGIQKKKHALKNPSVIKTIIEEAKKVGKAPKTLEDLVKKIFALTNVRG